MGELIRESKFEHRLIERLMAMFPNAMILKNDSRYIQGIPDRLILDGRNWAAFEVKRDEIFKPRPNQPYYIDRMNRMSYASFVFPQNEEEVLREIQRALQPRR